MVMSFIESLTRIKNAVYGREVREAIHDGVFRANQISDGADAKADKTQIRQDAVEAYNDQMIQEMTDKDVISAPEIIQARGGKPTLQARLDETATQLAQGVGISPLSFGAVGDGVTDDTSAILNTFDFAKATKSGVSFGDRTFVFNPNESVKFPYNVSFGSAKIIRTDRLSENIPILELTHEKEKITLEGSILSTEINKNTLVIPDLSGYGNAYVQIYDNTNRIFKRRGVTGDPGLGVSKFDQFRIDDNGNVLDEITVNFTNVTSIIVQPTDDYYTTISGGEFYTDGLETTSPYYTNGIVINKSNVILEKIKHNSITSSTSAPTDGFVVLKDCTNITLRDVGLKPRVYNPSYGTYDMPNFAIQIAIISS